MLRADLADALEVALRWNEHARRTGDRLDDHRGDGSRAQALHERLQLIRELDAVRGLAFRERVALRPPGRVAPPSGPPHRGAWPPASVEAGGRRGPGSSRSRA